MVQHPQGRGQLGAGEIPADAAEQGLLPRGHGIDGAPALRGQTHQVGAPMRRILHQLHLPVRERVVHHPLGELAAQLLGAGELWDGAVPAAPQLVQHVAHPDREAAELLVVRHDAGHATIYRPERDVDLAEARGELIRGEGFRHGQKYDTLGVMMVTTQFLDLPDQRIAYVDSGPSEGRVLVLLHGGALDKRSWGPQLSAFPGHRVLTVDARGHGESSDAEAPYRLADDVVALLDSLQIARAVPIGLSMGGGTAVDLALEHPERIEALVVAGTGSSEPVFTDPWALQNFADWSAAEQGGDPEVWIDVLQRFTAGPRRSLEDVTPGVRQLIDTMARDTLAHHLRLGPDGVPLPPVPPTAVEDTWARLPQIDVPVLAIAGELDGDDHRRMGRRLADSVSGGARYVEIAGAAHYPNLENPAAFDTEVSVLLSEL